MKMTSKRHLNQILALSPEQQPQVKRECISELCDSHNVETKSEFISGYEMEEQQETIKQEVIMKEEFDQQGGSNTSRNCSTTQPCDNSWLDVIDMEESEIYAVIKQDETEVDPLMMVSEEQDRSNQTPMLTTSMMDSSSTLGTLCVPHTSTEIPSSQLIGDSCSIIGKLLVEPYSSGGWMMQKKSEIVKNGRSTPKLDIQSDLLYKRMLWVSGCSKFNMYFCWPCLLFSKEGVWSIECGKTDVNKEAHKHQFSQEHKESLLKVNQDNCCIISKLLNKPFSGGAWSKHEKSEILKKGRPTPKLHSDPESEQFYKSTPWLSGCSQLNMYVCWFCLLISDNAAWFIAFGGRDVRREVMKHQVSNNHRKSTLKVIDSSCCIVSKLLNVPFSSKFWKEKEKSAILRLGRPTPTLDCDPQSDQLYKSVPWLSGCSKLKIYICWPCLMVLEHGTWSIGCGGNDVERKAGEHQFSAEHKKCHEQFRKQVNQKENIPENHSPILKLVSERLVLNEKGTTQLLQKARPIPSYDTIKEHMRLLCLDEATCRPLEDFSCFKTIQWLTGCFITNSMYCWPCLFFNPNDANLNIPLYKLEETAELEPFETQIREHERLKSHMSACVRYPFMKKKLMQQRAIKTMDKRSKYKLFTKNLINAICARKKLVLNSNSIVADYKEMMKSLALSSKIPIDLLNENFSSVNDEICDFIIQQIELMILTEIKKELEATKYVTCIIDSTSLPNKNLFSIFIRFLDRKGDVQERFVKLIGHELEQGGQATILLASKINSILNELGAEGKLVAFSYDGAFLKPDSITLFNLELQSSHPLAKFINYREHSWDVLFYQTISQLDFCEEFFHDVERLVKWLTETEGAIDSLMRINDNVNWNFDINKFIVILRNNYQVMLMLLKTITEQSNVRGRKTKCSAANFLEFLQSMRTRILILLIAEIYPTMGESPKELENEWVAGTNQAAECIAKMNELSAQFEGFYKLACDTLKCQDCPAPIQQGHRISDKSLSHEWDTIRKQILTFITNRDLWAEKNYFRANEFITRRPFSTSRDWKNDLMNLEKLELPIELDFCELSTELDALHSERRIFEDLSYNKLLVEYDMRTVTPELLKLLQFIYAIPMRATEDNGDNIAINRMKMYGLHNEQVNFRDAILWMEKELLSSLQETDEFYETLMAQLPSSEHSSGCTTTDTN